MNKKFKVVSILLVSTLALQGCSSGSTNSSKQTLATIDLNSSSEATDVESTTESTSEPSTEEDTHHLDIDVNEETHTFVIHADNDVLNDDLCGSILTYSYPETANVYVKNYDGYPWPPITYISEWQLVQFHSERLLTEDLSAEDGSSYIDSLARISTSDFEQMSIIQSAFPDVDFANYVIRSTYPPISTGLYNLTDMYSDFATSVDVVKNRGLDVYTVRQALDGIPFGLPDDLEVSNYSYDVVNEIWKHTEWNFDYYDLSMYYDGTSLYVTQINMDGVSEMYIENAPVLTLQEAFELADSAIYDILYYCKRYSCFNIHIYEAELVYIPIREAEVAYEDFQRNGPFYFPGGDTYLYPCWAIYYHYNYHVQSETSARRSVILVNAINGEIYNR